MIIDRAVQVYGATGVCHDTLLAYLWATICTLRIVDGLDEVCLQQLCQREESDRLLFAAGLGFENHW